jgi:hypothetical protein
VCEQTLEEFADDWQAQLLRFRLAHYNDFEPESVEVFAPTPRMRDLERALMLPFFGRRKTINDRAQERSADGLKPRKVGGILKNLGFRTQSISSLGRGLNFTPKNRRRIHDLFYAYGLRPEPEIIAECSLCKEYFGGGDKKNSPSKQTATRVKQTTSDNNA